MPFGRRNSVARRPWRLSAKLLIVSSVATVIGFSTICASVMLDMRRGEEELARQTLENLASGIDADISRNIELYDLSLRAVASNMVVPEIKDVSKPIRHLILFDHAATAKHFGAIQVFDAEGRLTIDASTLDPVARKSQRRGVFQGPSRQARCRPVHQPSDAASRRLCHRAQPAHHRRRRTLSRRGRGLDPLQLFSRPVRPPESRPGRHHHRAAPRPHDHHAQAVRPRHHRQEFGRSAELEPGEPASRRIVFGSRAPVDSIPRLYVRRDGTSPLFVVVGKPLDSILSLWRTEATRIGAIMLALIAFVLAVTLFLAREIGRRAQAEDKLEELATTDALTGLRNRRKFDAEIDAEWRRATRHKMPLALLMIDADHFKSYNDTFGHQAGDEMLVGIAICISDSVRRAGDCAARYGGEEFAVLLPGLSPAEAVGVAETIRLKVQEWSDGPTVTTVSIGIASLTPTADHGLVDPGESRRQGALRSQGRWPQPDPCWPTRPDTAHSLGPGAVQAKRGVTSPDTSSSPRAGRRADPRAPCRRRCWRAGSPPSSRNRAARPRTRRRRTSASWQARSWRR